MIKGYFSFIIICKCIKAKYHCDIGCCPYYGYDTVVAHSFLGLAPNECCCLVMGP